MSEAAVGILASGNALMPPATDRHSAATTADFDFDAAAASSYLKALDHHLSLAS